MTADEYEASKIESRKVHLMEMMRYVVSSTDMDSKTRERLITNYKIHYPLLFAQQFPNI